MLEVLILQKTLGEVHCGGILDEGVGQINDMGQCEEGEGNVVRVGLLINLSISNGNEGHNNGQKVQAQDGGRQKLLQVVFGSKLASCWRSGWASGRQLRAGFRLFTRTQPC